MENLHKIHGKQFISFNRAKKTAAIEKSGKSSNPKCDSVKSCLLAGGRYFLIFQCVPQ
jgi:hypothetical protein